MYLSILSVILLSLKKICSSLKANQKVQIKTAFYFSNCSHFIQNQNTLLYQQLPTKNQSITSFDMPQRSFITEEDKKTINFIHYVALPPVQKGEKKTRRGRWNHRHHYYASVGLVAKSCLKFLFTTIPSPTPCLHFPIYTTNHRYLQSFP